MLAVVAGRGSARGREFIECGFLELSIAIEAQRSDRGPGGADRLRRGQGLQPTGGEAKTTQVLRRLVAEAAC